MTSFLDAAAEARPVMKLDATLLRSRAGRGPRRRPSSWRSTAPTSRSCSGPGWAASPIAWRARAASRTRRCPAFPRRPSPATRAAWSPGTIAGKTALLLCGRVHGYEGYPPCEVGFGVRVVAALGVRTLIVTNASGGVDPTLAAGRHRRDLRPHQPDRRVAAVRTQRRTAGPALRRHDRRLRPGAARASRRVAAPAAIGRPLREAIYAGMAGPAYETPAEVRLLRTLGAGLVGMSTVHEVIAARHAGLAVLGPVAGRQPGRGRQPRSAAPRGRHARREPRARTRWAG